MPRGPQRETPSGLALVWQDLLWAVETLAVIFSWLLGCTLRLGRIAIIGLVAFGRWIAARPRRGVDLAIVSAVLVCVATLLKPMAPQQQALVVPALDYSSSQDCLALNIYHEARGEPREGQLAVAMVVMNRVKDPRFPSNVCGVIKEGGEKRGCQFSWWCDGLSDKPKDSAAWLESRRLADAVLSGDLSDPTGGALWYHADYVRPRWRMAITEGPKIGRHIFYASKSE